jgi:hypothetical protein
MLSSPLPKKGTRKTLWPPNAEFSASHAHHREEKQHNPNVVDKKIMKEANNEDFIEHNKNVLIDKKMNEAYNEEDKGSDSHHAADNSGESSDSYVSDGSNRPNKWKKAPGQFSKKQIELRQKDQQEELQKEAIIAERQEDIRFASSYLIIDEAHRLKNEASAFSHTVGSFETRYRILLTG